MQIVINTEGQGLRIRKFLKEFFELKGWELGWEHDYWGDADPVIVIRENDQRLHKSFYEEDIQRTDKALIKLVKSRPGLSYLKVITIPKNVKWDILFENGREYIQELGRRWG